MPLRRPLLRLLLAALLLATGPALAIGLPPAYQAIVIEAAGTPERAEFDLTAAQSRARAENKWLYVYLGARECPYCRKYEAFLDKNTAELLPHFARYLIVDLRSSLSVTADALFIKVGQRSLPYAEFQKAIGDERARMLMYPMVWLFDATLKPLMQMPAGTGTFQTVPEQLEILRLEQ